MLRLLLADLRHHAGSWAWTCVVALVAGACVSGQLMVMHGSLDSAGRATGLSRWGNPLSTEMADAARTTSGFVIASVVLAAAVVLSTTAGLVLSQRRRDHGLWRALGMRPGLLRALLLGQLVVVGALGSLGGALLGRPVSALMMPLLIDQDVALPGTLARWEPADLGWTALVVAGSVLLGGWGPARRAARATETNLLTGSQERSRSRPARALGVLTRLLVAGGLEAGVVTSAVAVHRRGAGSQLASEAAALGALYALVLVCVLTAWLVPLLLRGAALLPVPGPAWHVATRTAPLESRRSTATVLPFLIALGLVVIMLGGARMGVGSVRLSGFLSMLGLTLATTCAAVVASTWSGRGVGVATVLRARD
ncbi:MULTISPECIES: FtsX-like permease family protein [unclassified Actinomyces]|uniref:FtsX-like permease family protein n=2 Tax=Actinomyces TaxID=1654 RepID=UPI002016B121|nr:MULTISPECIES: FtsX-like permease family protein [unclassified Actinomyces]MCL3776711.1 ABC transporter permease [Actinomyces sp. AC-20-1]MCL3790829.1 ABC transporter permease [Actinomyces sp. 187325]MCL3793144.1 ABC transporter permease [Actinomyces sp. 186855]MCL3795581.1 ABC transporter permease [Actinomyces sp. 217892]